MNSTLPCSRYRPRCTKKRGSDHHRDDKCGWVQKQDKAVVVASMTVINFRSAGTYIHIYIVHLYWHRGVSDLFVRLHTYVYFQRYRNCNLIFVNLYNKPVYNKVAVNRMACIQKGVSIRTNLSGWINLDKWHFYPR